MGALRERASSQERLLEELVQWPIFNLKSRPDAQFDRREF
jgi:hypothetical protein